MAELLPTLMAGDLRRGLVDYLTTTFALADPEAAQALSEFLEDPQDGIFKGPYVRLRLPFRPADDSWRDSLGWDPGLTPYGHQAAAYERLTTIDLGPDKPRPLPTLVTTGTGSGKTEAFLHPILDHCVRANRAGVTGTKALILYPMNALATDQAGRLTDLLTTRPELSSVTAGIYIGEREGVQRTKVSRLGLINDRGALRDTPPDILLTNYKMLDQLLLRQQDQSIWAKSATSLTYLVLDEFHTYDGAQGTDVAMLLRRLGIALKSHWADGDPAVTDEDRARPLGRLTPVATSATLGDGGDPSTMRGFAETVFGEPLPSRQRRHRVPSLARGVGRGGSGCHPLRRAHGGAVAQPPRARARGARRGLPLGRGRHRAPHRGPAEFAPTRNRGRRGGLRRSPPR